MKRLIASAAILFFLGIFAGYLFVHADVSARFATCADAGTAHALCQGLGSSVTSWQQFLASSIPQLETLLFVAVVCALLFVALEILTVQPFAYIRARSLLPRDPFQQLFSDGILHPKRF